MTTKERSAATKIIGTANLSGLSIGLTEMAAAQPKGKFETVSDSL
jgi:hypothetical protein